MFLYYTSLIDCTCTLYIHTHVSMNICINIYPFINILYSESSIKWSYPDLWEQFLAVPTISTGSTKNRFFKPSWNTD